MSLWQKGPKSRKSKLPGSILRFKITKNKIMSRAKNKKVAPATTEARAGPGEKTGDELDVCSPRYSP